MPVVDDRAIAYHLSTAAWFFAQPAELPYYPEAFGREGFVHLTHGAEQVLEVGNRYYRGVVGAWLVLSVDLARVQADVRYDDIEQIFPHVYGPLDRAAIVACHAIERDADGRFIAIGSAVESVA